MEVASQIEVENELRSFTAEQLRYERAEITQQLKIIQEDISDLAFNNYRTYAAAGRTTQDCTEIFTEMNEKLREVTGEITDLQSEMKSFQNISKSLACELETVKSANDTNSPLWEMLTLPARMDLCIRSGYYEAAYSLTNYGMLMQQHTMIKNPLIKAVADKLVEARSLLLEELFNKFSGPMDLAVSLQVVNNVRKMPYLSPTQLRVSILQHKDLYLEKQLIDISTHTDFAIAAIDVYRTCMHDTLVLYLSVFPENEVAKRDPTVDPRWEQWPPCAPSAILGQWASRNISRLLDLIHRAEMKSGVDMASVWSKLMSIAATFGRMGLDFRPLIVQSLNSLVLDRFKSAIRKATTRLINEVKVISIVSGDVSIFDDRIAEADGSCPLPSAEISMWDDICIYANEVLTALNNMRYSHSTMLTAFTEFDLKELAATSDGSEHIEEVILPILQKKSLTNVDVILRKPEQLLENEEPKGSLPEAIEESSDEPYDAVETVHEHDFTQVLLTSPIPRFVEEIEIGEENGGWNGNEDGWGEER